MSIQVELKPEVEAMLQKRAIDRGCDVAGYVERLIEKDVLAAQSFDEILAPIRQGFHESGMSADELDTLFEEAREDRPRKKSPMTFLLSPHREWRSTIFSR